MKKTSAIFGEPEPYFLQQPIHRSPEFLKAYENYIKQKAYESKTPWLASLLPPAILGLGIGLLLNRKNPKLIVPLLTAATGAGVGTLVKELDDDAIEMARRNMQLKSDEEMHKALQRQMLEVQDRPQPMQPLLNIIRGLTSSLTKEGEKKDEKLKFKSFLPAISAAGISVVAVKGVKDVSNVKEKIDAWSKSLIEHAKTIKEQEQTFAEAEKSFKKYITKGQEISRTRVLGIPSGRYMQYGIGTGLKAQLAQKYLASKIDPRVKIQDWERHRVKKVIEHYKLFSDPKQSYEAIKSHIIEKGIGSPEMQNVLADKKLFSDEVKKVVFDTKTYPTFKQQYDKLKTINAESAEVFKNSILGNKSKGLIGEATRLSGNLKDVISTPEIYKYRLDPILPIAKETVNVLKRYTKPAVIGLAALPVLKYTWDKFAAKRKRDDLVSDALAGTGIAVGAVLTGVGGKRIIKPPKDIAVTYGVMENIGMGHKAPGQAIISAIKEDPRFTKANVQALERDQYSIYKYTPKRYALMVDAGLGGETHRWADKVVQTHGHRLPDKIKATKKLRYLTDMLSPTSGFGSNIHRGGKIISYGPYQERLKQVKMRPLSAGEVSPAMNLTTISEMRKDTKTPVIEDLINLERTKINTSTLKVDIDDATQNIKRLENLKGKKLISVVGAGRGDYVASRSKELVESLRRHGLDKEYGVLPVLSGAKGGVTEKLIKEVDLPSLGKLPRNVFGKIQQVADINWGSTGTSSLHESLALKSVLALPKKWGYADGDIKPDSIAFRQDKMLGKAGPHASLDVWNAGNIDFGLKQKGVIEANTAEDIVNVLKDKSKLDALKQESAIRSESIYNKLIESNKKMKDIIHKQWKSGIRLERLKGLGLGVGGVLLLGAGASQLKKSLFK